MRKHHPILPPSSFPMLERCPCYQSGAVGEAAESGSRQHVLLAALLKGEAVPEDRFGCDDVEVRQVEWAHAYIVHKTSASRQVEKRLALIGDDFVEITFGTLDVFDVVGRADGDNLVVMDYKSGEEHHYLPQMAVYARMAMAAYDKRTCEVHEIYGRKRFASVYRLNFQDTDFIVNIINRVQAKTRQPIMNEFCVWCARHGVCRAATGPIVQVATEYEPEHPAAALPMREVVTWHASQITDPEQMSIVLQIADHIGKWADAVKAHARKAALTGMAIPGYFLKQGRRTREVADIKTAYEASGLGVSEFLSCCKASVPELEETIAQKKGYKSAGSKAAKEEFRNMLGECIVFKENAPTLARG